MLPDTTMSLAAMAAAERPKTHSPVAAARLARVGPAHGAGFHIERIQPGSRLPGRRKSHQRLVAHWHKHQILPFVDRKPPMDAANDAAPPELAGPDPLPGIRVDRMHVRRLLTGQQQGPTGAGYGSAPRVRQSPRRGPWGPGSWGGSGRRCCRPRCRHHSP